MTNVMAALPNIGGVALSVQGRKVWLTPTRRRAVTLPRRETRGNLHECLKLPDRSHPLVGQSSPYYGACGAHIAA